VRVSTLAKDWLQLPLPSGSLTTRVWIGRFLIVGLLTIIVTGHGCHGDEIDHEPMLMPPRSEEGMPLGPTALLPL